jgi:murein DD-endopeptidase MepM/ murein hydrolase activator NlpD
VSDEATAKDAVESSPADPVPVSAPPLLDDANPAAANPAFAARPVAEPTPSPARVGGFRRPSIAPRDDNPATSARRRVLESRLPLTTDDESPTSSSSTDDTTAGSASSTDAGLEARREALRARVRARLEAVPRGGRPAEPTGPSAPRSSRRAVDDPLGLDGPIVRRPGPSASVERGQPAWSLSPRMTAVFGGLFGLATVTTIIALLIQGSPPRDDRALASAQVATPDAPVPRASALATSPSAPRKRERTLLPSPFRVGDLAKEPGVRVVEDTMNRRTLLEALGEKGVPKDQTYRVLKAFEGLRKFDKSSKNDRFIVAIDRASNALRGFEYVVSPLEVWQAREVDGKLAASQLDLKIADAEITGGFYVGKHLAASIAWGGLEPAIAKEIDEAFAGRTSTDGFDEGGAVRVIAIETTALGAFARYKQVVAVEYRPADPAASPVRAYAFEASGASGYWDEKGRQPDGSGWTHPVPGAPITSHFNPKRLHPVLKKVMPHNGTDYGGPMGTPIYSAFRGKITHVGPAGPCGNMVAIMHPNGIESGYCHMQKAAPGLKVGAPIGTKQLVGYLGSTGRSTGPHLHFWTKRDGKYFDSETLKMGGFRVLPADLRPAFAARKAELDARLDAIPLPEPPPPEPVASPSASGSARPDASSLPSDPTAEAAAPSGSAAPALHPPDPGDGDELLGADLSRPPTAVDAKKPR